MTLELDCDKFEFPNNVSNFSLIDESLIDNSEFLNGDDSNKEISCVDDKNINNADLLESLDLNYNLAKDKIEKNFNYLLNHLNNRKAGLLKKIENIYEKKCSNLKLNKNENELIGFTFDSDEDSSEFENDEGYDDSTSNDSNILKQIVKIISKFGRIIFTDAVETHCTASGEGVSQCFVNEEASFTLSCKDINGNLAKTHSSYVSAFITSLTPSTPEDAETVDCNLRFLTTGLFLVKYRIQKEGTYSLNVFLNNKHIQNSPFKLTCLNTRCSKLLKKKSLTLSNTSITNSFEKISPNSIQQKSNSKSGNGKDMLKSTSFIQAPKNGVYKNNAANSTSRLSLNVSAASTPRSATITRLENNSRLSMVATPNGLNLQLNNNLDSNFHDDTKSKSHLKDDLLLVIGNKGRGKGEFLNPQSICTANNLIYATDSNNQRVNVFTIDGAFKFCFGNQMNSTNNISALRRPIGLATLESDNKIFVCDYENKCVSIYDLNGKYQSKFGLNKLLGPKGVCVNKAANSEIIIADCKANSVYIFSLNGKLIKHFGSQGNKNENFAAPHYVSCLSDGNIVISDFYNHCVKVFSHEGSFLYSFGTHGSNQGQFNGPTGICCDQYDNIVVADWGIEN